MPRHPPPRTTFGGVYAAFQTPFTVDVFRRRGWLARFPCRQPRSESRRQFPPPAPPRRFGGRFLASELKTEVEKTDSTTILSLAMLKKADEIEKLAKQIKDQAKG